MTTTQIFLAALALTLLSVIHANAASLPFQGLDEKTLIQMGSYGPIVLVEGKPSTAYPWVSAGALIEAPPEVVWKVVTSFAEYKAFLPQTKKSAITRTEGSKSDVDLAVRVDFTSLIGVTVEYSLRYEQLPPYRVTWESIGGDVKYSRGEWNILPLDGGKRCMLFYSISSDLKSMGAVVGYVLKKQPSLELAIQTSTAILVVDATKKHAETIAKGK